MIRRTPEEVATWLCNSVPAMRPQYGPEDEAVIAQAIRTYERLHVEPLLEALRQHFNRVGAASDPELAEAFAQYCTPDEVLEVPFERPY